MTPVAASAKLTPRASASRCRRQTPGYACAIVAVIWSLGSTAIARAVEIGSPAPAFSLAALHTGKPIALEQFRGKVVFVDFWASWCGPCRQSLPLYEQLRTQFTDAPLVILAINVDENEDDATAFLHSHPVNYTILRDPQGTVPAKFGVTGMPSSYLIDRDGIVRAKQIGFEPKDIDSLRTHIRSLLQNTDHAH